MPESGGNHGPGRQQPGKSRAAQRSPQAPERSSPQGTERPSPHAPKRPSPQSVAKVGPAARPSQNASRVDIVPPRQASGAAVPLDGSASRRLSRPAGPLPPPFIPRYQQSRAESVAMAMPKAKFIWHPPTSIADNEETLRFRRPPVAGNDALTTVSRNQSCGIKSHANH